MQLSRYFLRNAGLVGGVSTEIDSFWFFSDLSIWFRYKNIMSTAEM